MTEELRYCIEKRAISSGNLTGLVLDIKTLRWMHCSNKEYSFPSYQAAEAYANENGFTIGTEVEITTHTWDDGR